MRRTRLEALATRDGILDAAELVFQRRGVSRACLEEIARVAGVTRGAVYWHFEDKAALFRALVERFTFVPFEIQRHDSNRAHALSAIRRRLLVGIRAIQTEPRLQRVAEILLLKVEHVDEMLLAGQRQLAARRRFVALMESAIEQSIECGELAPDTRPTVVALTLWVTLEGLVRNWLLDPMAFDLYRTARQMIDCYLVVLEPKRAA
jgi:TetR/AcrR family acrAB operon transcriptional repressor